MTHTHPRAPQILVVEDDRFVRDMILDVLTEAGFAVCHVAGGGEAMVSLALRPDIDVVVTDIDMPGTLDGIELAGRIHQCWPGVGVVLVSGGSRVTRPIPPRAKFLAKPFSAAALLRSIRGFIGEGEPLRVAS